MSVDEAIKSVSKSHVARVGDMAGEGAGGRSVGRGQVDLRVFRTHAADEVAVRRADHDLLAVGASEGVDRAAQAGRARRRRDRIDAGRLENVSQALAVDAGFIKSAFDLARGRHEQRADRDTAALHDSRRHDEILSLPPVQEPM